MTVEDNLYLALLGVRSGHLRPVRSRADTDMRERARAMAERWASRARSTEWWASSHTASSASSGGHGARHRSEADDARRARGRAVARGARTAHRPAARSSTPAITLILIEHDMDVALGVAGWVTMMHNGAFWWRGPRKRSVPTRLSTSSTWAAGTAMPEPADARGGGAQRLLRQRPRAPGRELQDGRRSRGRDRAQRHG